MDVLSGAEKRERVVEVGLRSAVVERRERRSMEGRESSDHVSFQRPDRPTEGISFLAQDRGNSLQSLEPCRDTR